MSIIDFIEKYRKKPRTLFTTPSHGQGDFVVPLSSKFLGRKYFKADYSEYDDFDNLASPQGIIRKAQEEAARIYRAKASFFLVNGSTSGILAAMMTVLSKGDKVLIARNCHKSVYNGLVLTGALPIWIMPEFNEEWGIYENINLNKLNETLLRNKDIKALILTNPTYEGVMTNISKVSDICKTHGVTLIVDEAHGALWNFYRALGTPSILQGADIVIQSLHKTAGAINPSAIMHISDDSEIKPQKIQDCLNLITTTSPSYPVLMNIEATISYLDTQKGKLKIYELAKYVSRLNRVLRTVANIDVYNKHNDLTKILVKINNLSGFELSDILFNKYNIECELANEQSVLFLTGLGTTKTKLKKLEKALLEIAENNIKIKLEDTKHVPPLKIEPRVRYTPASVWGKMSKEVDIKYSLSRVSMEMIIDYPPGIPILLPGEVIRKEHIEYLKDRKKIRVLI